MTTTRTSRPRRRLLAALAVLALFAAACGDDGEGTETDDDTTTDDSADDTTDDDAADDDAADDTAADDAADDADVERTASFQGVTEDTITIAVSYLDFATLVELNLSPNGWGDQELVYQTLIDDINANGGIFGRTLEVATYEKYSPVDQLDADADCVSMTQDNEVFLVLGGFLGPTDQVNPCIVDLNETALVGGALKPEQVATARAPWFDFRPSEADQATVLLDLLDQTGRAEGAEVFVITLDGAQDLRDILIERMGELGISVVDEAVLDVPDGEQTAQDAAMAAISERVRSSGANTVLMPGGVSAVIRGLANAGLATELELWTADRDGLRNLGESVDRTTADGTITVDRLTPTENWEDPLMVECAAIFTAANPDVEVKAPIDVLEGEDAWFQSITSYCSRTALLVELLEAAGPNPTYETLQAGADAIGQFSLPGIPNASLGPDKLGADDSFRLSVFDPNEGDKGDVVPLTEILDATP